MPPDPRRPAPPLDRLLTWYAGHARDLPWRAPDVTPWGVLVSEVMLQQTPVARVQPVWLDWLARWPDPARLAGSAPGEAIRHWGRLGYPRRALRLHEAATAITDRYAGQVPSAPQDLLSLPGIGSYTAAAVASFAFGARVAVVDTNVRRVQARAVSGRALPAPALSAAEVRLATSLLPTDDATVARWNVAVMELGALVCTARAPRCGECPIRDGCAWQLAGAPAYDGPPRPGQAWDGTDRQVRGRLLAALRATEAALPRGDLRAAAGDVEPAEGWAQVDRCLAGLVADGLVQVVPAAPGVVSSAGATDERYRLPV